MNKAELTEAILANAKEGDIKNKAAAHRIVDGIFDIIKNEVANGNEVAIANFGTFRTVDKSERTGLNPQTGESITIPAHKTPKFAPGKGFKDAVNK
jgi:DNA-binding protein HU-beta